MCIIGDIVTAPPGACLGFRTSCGNEWTRAKRKRRWPWDVWARCKRTTCTWGPEAARCISTTWRRWTKACTGVWLRRWTGWRASRRPYSKTRTSTRTWYDGDGSEPTDCAAADDNPRRARHASAVAENQHYMIILCKSLYHCVHCIILF